MTDPENLVQFLERKRVSQGEQCTHTSWGATPRENGRYFIGEDELDTFYELYHDWVDVCRKDICLNELGTPLGPMRVDLDFVYDKTIKSNQHTQDQVVGFVKAYMDTLANYLVLPSDTRVYVMEKKRPVLKGDGTSSGIHILLPDIISNKYIEIAVRNVMLTRMGDFFESLPLKERAWTKVYDEGVAKHSSWQVYGSKKPNGLPYLVAYTVKYSAGEVEVDKAPVPMTPTLVKSMSVRVLDESRETKMTDSAEEEYGSLPQSFGREDVRISGGRAALPTRGRPAERRMPGSRDSSPNPAMNLRPLTEEDRMYYRDHIRNLSMERATDYHRWVEVGQCLKNIHPDLYDEFEEFSRRDSDKFNLRACMQKWDSFAFRNDGQRLMTGSLLYWSRLDNPEGYKAIQENNILRKIDLAMSGTEHDVATVVYAKYHDVFKCVSFGKNVWYKFSGHVWKETDKGVELQCQLSKEVWKLFFQRANAIGKQMESFNVCSAKMPAECGCEFCELAMKRDGLNKICTKLKTTKYKENVMKECRELFLDETFLNKVDEDKRILACRNGVYDMTSYPCNFRDGKQEDCLSFSTGLDFDKDIPYSAYEAWHEVDAFLKQVLPDNEVRDYFLKHLSTCLAGGSEHQKFHILTGTGSNGKSMLMNLTETALGDYACKVPISMLTQGRNKSSAASPEVIRLKGRRFITMQEPDEAMPLNTGIMKELTSAEKILARDLYAGSKSMIEFELQGKFHLACNDKPKVNSNDGGTWRRLVVINFLSKFVPHPSKPNEFRLDPSIEHKVKSEKWGRAFLAYLMHLYSDGCGLSSLVPPEKIMEYTKDYREESDALAKFDAECIAPVDDPETVVPVRKAHLTDAFKKWWDTNKGTRDYKLTEMIKYMETKYGKYSQKGWKNFQLRLEDS
jgi:P4 family phage/plasmid primase-like protien